MKPTLHMIGLFHTTNSLKRSHCAFTGKALRFPKMMQMQGYNVIDYSNGESESTANKKVQIMTEERLDFLKGCYLQAVATIKDDGTISQDNLFRARNSLAFQLVANKAEVKNEHVFEGDTAVIGSPHWVEFNSKLIKALSENLKPWDIICHPFGRAHETVVHAFKDKIFHVETGIGYGDEHFGAFRIYESNAWRAHHQGAEKKGGNDYEWVIPNYYDLTEWETNHRAKNDGPLIYFGRITGIKGSGILNALAEALQEEILCVGQGEIPADCTSKFLKKCAPVTGRDRSALLGSARALLMPTRYIEPFGGAGVEGQLCGTPLIASNFGCFNETLEHGVTGFNCNTLGDWVGACEKVKTLDRTWVSERARRLYSLETCSKQFDNVFQQISELGNGGPGWYTKISRI